MAEFSTRLQYLPAGEMDAAEAELAERTSEHFAEKAVKFFRAKAGESGAITPSLLPRVPQGLHERPPGTRVPPGAAHVHAPRPQPPDQSQSPEIITVKLVFLFYRRI
jgi:hypothetical protein